MKINTNGLSNSPLAPKLPVLPTQTSPQTSTKGLPQDSSAYTPSSEWLHLLDQVRQQPDIREDRVSAVMERLRQGYYATPDIAAKTAAAKLDSLD